MGTPLAPSPCRIHGTPTTPGTPHTRRTPAPSSAPPRRYHPSHAPRHASLAQPSQPVYPAGDDAILNDYAECVIDRRGCMILLYTKLHKPIISATPAERISFIHQFCYTLIDILIRYRFNISRYRVYLALISVSMVILQVEDDACHIALPANHAPL